MIIEELNLKMNDDSKEMNIIINEIDKKYSDITYYYDKKCIEKTKYNQIKEGVEDILYALADLSIPYFRINEDLRNYYLIKYKKDPNLSRMLYLNRYSELHKPYDVLKNKCYLLFRKLEKIKIV